MKDLILDKLKQIEIDNNIKILFAVEAGSRATNLSSIGSDYDIRFVYCHTTEWYLSVDVNNDVIEMVNDLFDIGGWGIRKSLKLFSNSNPSILEWIHSPIVYLNPYHFIEDLKILVPEYYSIKSRLNHSLSIATNNYRTYLQDDEVKLKRYFGVLKPLLSCMWTEKFTSIPPLDFDTLVNELIFDPILKSEILQIVDIKRNGDMLQLQPQNPIINEFIEEKLVYYKTLVNSIKTKDHHSLEKLDQLFRKTLKDVWK